jgi:hypothetical protein
VCDRPKLPILHARRSSKVFPNEPHDGPDLLDALTRFVHGFNTMRAVGGDLVEAPFKLLRNDTGQLLREPPPTRQPERHFRSKQLPIVHTRADRFPSAGARRIDEVR